MPNKSKTKYIKFTPPRKKINKIKRDLNLTTMKNILYIIEIKRKLDILVYNNN